MIIVRSWLLHTEFKYTIVEPTRINMLIKLPKNANIPITEIVEPLAHFQKHRYEIGAITLVAKIHLV